MKPKLTKTKIDINLNESEKENVEFSFKMFFLADSDHYLIESTFFATEAEWSELKKLNERLYKCRKMIANFETQSYYGMEVYLDSNFNYKEKTDYGSLDSDKDKIHFLENIKNTCLDSIKEIEDYFNNNDSRSVPVKRVDVVLNRWTDKGWTEMTKDTYFKGKLSFEAERRPNVKYAYVSMREEIRPLALREAIRAMKKHTNLYRAVCF